MRTFLAVLALALPVLAGAGTASMDVVARGLVASARLTASSAAGSPAAGDGAVARGGRDFTLSFPGPAGATDHWWSIRSVLAGRGIAAAPAGPGGRIWARSHLRVRLTGDHANVGSGLLVLRTEDGLDTDRFAFEIGRATAGRGSTCRVRSETIAVAAYRVSGQARLGLNGEIRGSLEMTGCHRLEGRVVEETVRFEEI